VTEPDMGSLHDDRHAVQQNDLVAEFPGQAAVVGDRLDGSIGGMVESNWLEALDLVAER
jgi:hypothetical protein